MTMTVQATYENGVLKPEQPLPLREQERVEVVIHPQGRADTGAPRANGRQAALARLISLELPVGDWEQMEEEIIRGAVEG